MKRLLSLALPLVLAGAMTVWAQSDTTPSPSSTNPATSPSSSSSTQSNAQDSSATQANPATSSTMAQSGTSQTRQPSLEGCIIREQNEYFLQPATGQPVKLSSSEDLSRHVGHRVRVLGTVANEGNNGSDTNPASSGAGVLASTAGTQYQAITVSKVETISETCPSGMQNQSVPNSQSPK